MSESRCRRPESAGEDERGGQRARIERDELGEMREGMNPGILVSQDFRTVNRHFSSAFENGLKSKEKVSSYCDEIFQQARASEDLAVKKLLFMTVLCLDPDVCGYYAKTCPPKKFLPWIETLRPSLECFVSGKHRDGVSKCASATDAKYRSVEAFVGAMVATYVNF
jgi:hypothetical protein